MEKPDEPREEVRLANDNVSSFRILFHPILWIIELMQQFAVKNWHLYQW